MKNFKTGNIGHDVAKARLANSLNSYDIVAIRRELLKHPTIKTLTELNAVRVSPVVGQNFTIGAKNQLLSDLNRVCTYEVRVVSVKSEDRFFDKVKRWFK